MDNEENKIGNAESNDVEEYMDKLIAGSGDKKKDSKKSKEPSRKK